MRSVVSVDRLSAAPADGGTKEAGGAGGADGGGPARGDGRTTVAVATAGIADGRFTAVGPVVGPAALDKPGWAEGWADG